MEKEFGQKLHVTSSKRTPKQQAQAMYPHFESNSSTLNSYAAWKKKMLAEIKTAFDTGRRLNLSKSSTILLMENVIIEQVNRKEFISFHLNDSARDISVKGIKIKELLILLRKRNELFVNDETNTSQPHIHIHLK